MGGYDSIDVNTTEFVYANKRSEVGPTLDFIIAHHCMEKVSNSAIYIIGKFNFSFKISQLDGNVLKVNNWI